MVSSRKLQYDTKRKYNAVTSGKKRNITNVDLAALINEAQETWFQNKASIAQVSEKVRNDLRPWLITRYSPLIEGSGNYIVANYPKDLFKRLNQLIIAKKSCCPKVKEIIPRIVQSDDLHEARRNPYRKPDFFYEQGVALEDQKGLIVYLDGAYEVDDFLIDYYRVPGEIHFPSLEECEGPYYYDYNGKIINKDSDFEGDVFAANDITDIAALMALKQDGATSIQDYQLQLSHILQKSNYGKTD